MTFHKISVIALIAALVLTGLVFVPPARAAGPITLLSLTRFVCAGPSFDFVMAGVFAADDGGGSDLFEVRVQDGAGVLLYSAIGSAAAMPGQQQVVVSYTDASGATPDPTVNPIRIEVYDRDRAGVTGLLAAAEFSVICLQSGVVPLLPADLVIVGPPGTAPMTASGLPVLAPPPGPALQPPLSPANGLPAQAQFNANMRVAPNRQTGRITIVAANTPLTLLGRTRNGYWVLAQDMFGNVGWIVTGAQSANLALIAGLPPVQ